MAYPICLLHSLVDDGRAQEHLYTAYTPPGHVARGRRVFSLSRQDEQRILKHRVDLPGEIGPVNDALLVVEKPRLGYFVQGPRDVLKARVVVPSLKALRRA